MFNVEKTADEYKTPSLFLNPKPGLVDTINKRFPDIWDIYKRMRSYDWSEDDITHESALKDFRTAPENIVQMMLKTLMWQWEADSVVSRAPTVLIAPFNPCLEVWACEQRITDNEQIHANTYSEIVRTGMDNPLQVIETLLQEVETFKRLNTVDSVLNDFYGFSRCIETGVNIDKSTVYDQLAIFYFTLLCLERVQFMASFAITFTIAESGFFQSIGQAVKMICRDELEVHCEYRKAVLKHIMEEHTLSDTVKDKMQKILSEVVESEFAWTDYLFEHHSLLGTNKDQIKKWVLYNVADITNSTGIQYGAELPKENPLKYLEKWIDINAMQPSPQEQDSGQYKMGTIQFDDTGEELEF